MKKLLLLICISVILLSSCDWLLDALGGGTKTFWAINMTTERFYQLSAELLAENEYCEVWVERGSGVTQSTAEKMAAEYLTIRTKMLNAFGSSIQIDGKNYDTIQIADYYGNEDGKLTILLLDIKDGYRKDVNDEFVAGYFYSGDFYPDESADRSNECDMIYVDTNPALKEKPEDAYSTLAHELQHMMNFATSLMYRSEKNDKGQITRIYQMDTWINEGLSSAAEYVYSGEHLIDRWGWYYLNGDGDGLIDKGNNFFVWGNRKNENPYANQDDYATVYLFFQWLRIQSGGTEIYKEIIKSDKNNYLAVTGAASKFDSSYNGNWERLLGDWLSANYIYDPNGRHGYKDDFKFYNKANQLLTIKGLHLLSTTAKTVNLYPGEGVFSKINGSYNTSNNVNIRYSKLIGSGIPDALLTYNVNTVITDTFATGSITGVRANVNVADPVNGRSVASQFSITGPYRIGAGDVNGGFRDLPPAGVLQLPNSLLLREE